MRVIVIGAGIGGLAAAIALRRAGLMVEVHEQAPELREVGAGIGLWAHAIRALDRIDLGDVVRATAVPLLEPGLFTSHGRQLMRVSREELDPPFGDVTVVIHRAELLDFLIAAFGRDHIRLSHTCVGFEQNAGGVTAKFNGGETASGDALIGADGLYSVVRARLHGDVKPVYAGYSAWRAVAKFDHARLRPGESWGSGARFGQFPLSDGRVYWFACVNTPEGQRSPAGEKARLQTIFANYHDPIPALIEATAEETILRNDIYDRRTLRRWGNERVTLLGDAAHPMTPNLGQGACQALEDAVVLAECLRGASDASIALRTYEHRRLRGANAIVTRSRTIGRIAQLRHPLLVALRNAVFRRIPRRLREREAKRVMRDSG